MRASGTRAPHPCWPPSCSSSCAAACTGGPSSDLPAVGTSEACRDAFSTTSLFSLLPSWCPACLPSTTLHSPLSLGASSHLVCPWEVTLPSCCITASFGHCFLQPFLPGPISFPLLAMGTCLSSSLGLTRRQAPSCVSSTCPGSSFLPRGVLPPMTYSHCAHFFPSILSHATS